MSEYDAVSTSSLKLKGVSEHKIKKKKKKKDKEKSRKMFEQISSHATTDEGETKKIKVDKRTKAEIAFEKATEAKEFNKQLDNLTEHFDIPKVSWTK
ncbi:hypothetical protein KUTeg_000891 [Tegillarca granosa]|nr:hypothetical protein KUTeg_000891 [Tegillarca granosa]